MKRNTVHWKIRVRSSLHSRHSNGTAYIIWALLQCSHLRTEITPMFRVQLNVMTNKRFLPRMLSLSNPTVTNISMAEACFIHFDLAVTFTWGCVMYCRCCKCAKVLQNGPGETAECTPCQWNPGCLSRPINATYSASSTSAFSLPLTQECEQVQGWHFGFWLWKHVGHTCTHTNYVIKKNHSFINWRLFVIYLIGEQVLSWYHVI